MTNWNKNKLNEWKEQQFCLTINRNSSSIKYNDVSSAARSTTLRDVQSQQGRNVLRARITSRVKWREILELDDSDQSYRELCANIYMYIHLLRRNKFSGNICPTLCRASWNIRLRKEISLRVYRVYLGLWIKLFLSMPIVREREEATPELLRHLACIIDASVIFVKNFPHLRHTCDYVLLNQIRGRIGIIILL